LPADADLAAAFSIPVSAKPAAGVRWAIGMARIRICRPAKTLFNWPKRHKGTSMLRSFGATQDKESIKDLTNKKMADKTVFTQAAISCKQMS